MCHTKKVSCLVGSQEEVGVEETLGSVVVARLVWGSVGVSVAKAGED